MEKSRVCILTAGSGSRLGEQLQIINKSLIPLGDKAVLSRIIESFPSDSEFIIALGHRGEQVRDYLSLAHPGLSVKFVEVANFEGPGSGPGESLRSCRHELQSGPFYFVSCDTLWSDKFTDFPSDENWMAVSEISPDEAAAYSLIFSESGRVTDIRDKYSARNITGGLAFTGFAFIYDHEDFWAGLEQINNNPKEKQVMDGFIGLMQKRPVRAVPLKWTDVGTLEKYRKAYGAFADFDYSKSEEFFYSVNSRIVKFFADRAVVKNRVAKAKLMPRVFPQVFGGEGQFYAYDYQKGDTFYKLGDRATFDLLIQWLRDELWKPRDIDEDEFKVLCRKFYVDKTVQRLELYNRKYGSQAEIINGVRVPLAETLFSRVDQKQLISGLPFFIHGDLQPDNIIFDRDDNRFVLIDWRQDFSGRIDLGDLYYDFAKLLGGLQMDYSAIKRNRFEFEEIDGHVKIGHESVKYGKEATQSLKAAALKMGLDFKKVEMLTGLIYLNMAPLHHYPFDKLLNAKGRLILGENLS